MTDLDGVDVEMGKALNKFVSLWRLLAAFNKEPMSRDASTDYKEMQDEVEEKRKILTVWENKIRTGNR